MTIKINHSETSCCRPYVLPGWKKFADRPRMTTKATYNILIREVLKKKRITAVKFKIETVELPEKVSIRTIQHLTKELFLTFQNASAEVRRPSTSNRYDPSFAILIAKHPNSHMVWSCFSGSNSRRRLFRAKKT